MTEQKLLDALNDPEVFRRVMSSVHRIIYLCEDYPEYVDQIAARVLDDLAEFQQLTKVDEANDGAAEVVRLVNALPNHVNQIASLVLDNLAEFQRLTEDTGMYVVAMALRNLVTAFPNHVEQIASRVFDDPIEFQRLTRYGARAVPWLIELFPRHANQLATKILDDVTEFQRMTQYGSYGTSNIMTVEWDAIGVLMKAFPHAVHKIASMVLDNFATFQLLTRSDRDHQGYTLWVLAKFVFPAYANKLASMVFNNLSEFRRLTKNHVFILDYLVGAFPNHRYKIASIILDNPTELKRFTDVTFFGNRTGLEELVRVFPSHAEFFGQSTKELALKAWQDRRLQQEDSKEIEKNVRSLYQGIYLPKQATRKFLADDLIVEIAAMTGNKHYHSEETAKKVARAQLIPCHAKTACLNSLRSMVKESDQQPHLSINKFIANTLDGAVN